MEFHRLFTHHQAQADLGIRQSFNATQRNLRFASA